jgi:DNA-directed RNA polymerase alpha subunit
MEIKVETEVKKLELSTDLSGPDLSEVAVRLSTLGPVGERALKIVRNLVAAIENIEGATSELKLVALASEDGALKIAINLSSASEGCSLNSSSALPITELELSARARNVLNKLGIVTLNDVTLKAADDLLDVKNSGHHTVSEVRRELAKFNLKLKGE